MSNSDLREAHAQHPTAYLHRCPKYGHKPSLSFEKAINPDWTSEPLYLAHCRQPTAWRKSMELVVWWLEGCLKCKEWQWDGQQREAAEDALKGAQAALETDRRTPAEGEAEIRSEEIAKLQKELFEARQALLRKGMECDRARAQVESMRECLQSIADMKEDEPREPDDADWRWRALECKRCATVTLTSTEQSRG